MMGIIEFDLAAWVVIRELVDEAREVRERNPAAFQIKLEMIFNILEDHLLKY